MNTAQAALCVGKRQQWKRGVGPGLRRRAGAVRVGRGRPQQVSNCDGRWAQAVGP